MTDPRDEVVWSVEQNGRATVSLAVEMPTVVGPVGLVELVRTDVMQDDKGRRLVITVRLRE